MYQEGESAWGITFPDIAGCFAAADSFDEIQAKANEALSLWAEDSELPEPTSLEAIRLSHGDALADGATLMEVSYKP